MEYKESDAFLGSNRTKETSGSARLDSQVQSELMHKAIVCAAQTGDRVDVNGSFNPILTLNKELDQVQRHPNVRTKLHLACCVHCKENHPAWCRKQNVPLARFGSVRLVLYRG